VLQCVADATYVPGQMGRVSTFGSVSEGGELGDVEGIRDGVSVDDSSSFESDSPPLPPPPFVFFGSMKETLMYITVSVSGIPSVMCSRGTRTLGYPESCIIIIYDV
jgi:hypothetical protein